MKINLIDKVIFKNVETEIIVNKSNNIEYYNESGIIQINFDELIDGINIFPMNASFEIESNLVKMGYYVYAYKSERNNLIIYKGNNIISNTDLIINFCSYQKELIKFNITPIIINKNEKINNLVLIERKTKVEYNFPINNKSNKVFVPPKDITENGTYDLFINVVINNDVSYRKRVGKYSSKKEMLLREKKFNIKNNTYIISPRTTYKAKYLAINFAKISRSNNELFNDSLVRKKKYWLIGEQPLKAQDNGYYFFKYCRENHPDMPIYYVIDKKSNDFKKVAKLGNIIEFGSKEHYAKLARAKYLITTHHDHYLFPYHSKSLAKKIKAKRIFLQHGVMGTKYMADFYGKNNPNFRADMVVVSSQREKEMLVDDFEYNNKDVVVTGLSRFDNLFTTTKVNKEVCIIPTWRDWLTTSIDFTTTEYFEKYSSLVKSLAEKGYDVTFILHINMAQYKQDFLNMGIDVYTPSDIDVQNVIKTSKVLITDYSSVSFDFAFLNKPVIYYQFDQAKFFGTKGSHFDIYSELPGDILTTELSVINKLSVLKNNDYIVSEENAKKIENLCEYKDTSNSKRLYQIIKDGIKPTRSPLYKNEYVLKAQSFYRRSKVYYPSMKLMYNILSHVPKKDYVLIECNNGNSITDSPKEIYLKWSEINPEQKFIFSYNYILPHKYKHNAKAIKRLSPSYFYYMATSKVWINNQNFPHYFTNRKTLNMQTWHGTPIKKMLHDIEVIHGRDSGYVERVDEAISNWSYLLSPSSYASECYKRAFKNDCEIIEYGYPRNDFLHDTKKMNELSLSIKEKFGIEENKKVILFAPTFRDDAKKVNNKFVLDLKFDFDKFYEMYSEEYVVLFKFHFLSVLSENLPKEYNNTFINVTSHVDINELFSVADILVTDYSSVMFDFINTGRKTILYAHDLENYEQNNRGFYLNYKTEAPGVVVETFDEMLKEIKDSNFNYDFIKCKERFASKYSDNSTEKIVEFITSKVK